MPSLDIASSLSSSCCCCELVVVVVVQVGGKLDDVAIVCGVVREGERPGLRAVHNFNGEAEGVWLPPPGLVAPFIKGLVAPTVGDRRSGMRVPAGPPSMEWGDHLSDYVAPSVAMGAETGHFWAAETRPKGHSGSFTPQELDHLTY